MTREEILRYCELVGYEPPSKETDEKVFKTFKDLFGEGSSNPFKEEK